MSRVLVKARVFALDAIPWFFTFAEGTAPDTNTWTVQCEVLQAAMIGALPQDEDQLPDQPDGFDPKH